MNGEWTVQNIVDTSIYPCSFVWTKLGILMILLKVIENIMNL